MPEFTVEVTRYFIARRATIKVDAETAVEAKITARQIGYMNHALFKEPLFDVEVSIPGENAPPSVVNPDAETLAAQAIEEITKSSPLRADGLDKDKLLAILRAHKDGEPLNIPFSAIMRDEPAGNGDGEHSVVMDAIRDC